MRQKRAEIMSCNVSNAIMTFCQMTTDERQDYISRYGCLLPYEKTALYQCKKYMNTAERKAYKQAIEASRQCELEEIQVDRQL